MNLRNLLLWFSGKNQTTCPRCGGPMTTTTKRRRWFPAMPTCPQCDLRARWAESPERRRV